MSWTVEFSGKAAKQVLELPEAIQLIARALVADLKQFGFSLGPERTGWKNFGALQGYADTYHCHLKKGRPTYVACWRVADKKWKLIEVFYVGTHEKAPY